MESDKLCNEHYSKVLIAVTLSLRRLFDGLIKVVDFNFLHILTSVFFFFKV